MTDHALDLLDFEFAAAPAVELAVPTIPVPTLAGVETEWEFFASDKYGAHNAVYPTAKMRRILWTLDAPATCEFDIPIDAVDLDQLPLPKPGIEPPEIQVYRNGHLIFWGPVIARRADSTERIWHYTAADPLWYLMKRNMGESERHNYLGNSSFDVTAAGWTDVGSVSSSIDNVRYLIGGGSLNMTNPGSASGEDFKRKTFTISSGPLGLVLILTAWYYVDAFANPAYSRRAAFLGRVGATGPGSYGYSILDVNTPLGTFLRMSTHVSMPPNTTETIDARLYCPEGEVHVDGVTVTIMESLSFVNENSAGGLGWDQTLIAQMTSRYLSGALPVGNPYTKSNVRIATAGAASGIKKERTYQFYDAQPGYQGGVGSGALDEWPRANEGFDYRIDYDSPTVRTFRTYYPYVGESWAEPFAYVRVIVDDEVTDGGVPQLGIIGWEYPETIEGSATNIRELGGFGDGAGREEGTFSDPTALGGLTLELVESAPSGAPLDLLDNVAKQRGEQLARSITTPILRMAEPKDPITDEVTVPLIGVLMPGDFLSVTLLDGSVGIFTTPRVTQVQLNPDETLSVAIAL